MEYIYSAMLLHSAGKKIDASNIKKVLEAAGVKPDDGRIKALTASLEGVDIEKAIKTASLPVAPAAAAPATSAPAEEKSDQKKDDKKKKEEEEEEEEVSEEEAAAGLGALFG
jgi:large subunit ribosomal protein L12